MAVYTHVSAEALAALLTRYDVGELVSAKGIAEGVENSNYLVDTTANRFILTLYEKRVDAGDLPFFLTLLDHLADRGLPVPQAVRDRDGAQIQTVAGRPACLIEFLPGVSVTHPTPAQAYATGAALGRMHEALAEIALDRPNTLGLADWHVLAARCGDDLDRIEPGLRRCVARELDWLDAHWPADLPRAIVHGDLFPDNVLLRGDAVGGLIDFYFACTEVRAWDLAVAHAAWSFAADGTGYDAGVGDAWVERCRARGVRRARAWRVPALRADARVGLAEYAGRRAGHAQGSARVSPPPRPLRRAVKGAYDRTDPRRDRDRWRVQG